MFLGPNSVPVVLVGNKIDLSPDDREVTWQDASDYVSTNIEHGAYVETSAKYNLHIEQIFNQLLALAFGQPKVSPMTHKTKKNNSNT